MTTLLELVQQDVEVRRCGKEYVARCVFHQETHPSLYINAEKGLYLCRSCGKGGDTISWLREHRGMSFPDAARLVGKEISPADRKRARDKQDARDAVLTRFFTWKRKQFRELDEIVRELYFAEVAYRSLCRSPETWPPQEQEFWITYLGDLYLSHERLIWETDLLLDDAMAWQLWLESTEEQHE